MAPSHRRADEHKVVLYSVLGCAAVGALVMLAAAGSGITLLVMHLMRLRRGG
jgi:hypothetical protein